MPPDLRQYAVRVSGDAERRSFVQAGLAAVFRLATRGRGPLSSQRSGDGGRAPQICHGGVAIGCRRWLARLVLSRFSSGYLIANLAIKETDHGTTIR
uniref:Uncharacterized protein n=1 Tax=uncultured Rhodospirillales bacterium HF4000_24M03 TaxID=710788 RepID=E0XW49_9PROT|nr:hypothetical protein [uncultured Rhodospirillales bacterium HF4000_24M03]